MQMQINVAIAPSLVEPLDTVAQSLCKANDGEAYTRLLVGLFALPPEPITDQLDPTKTYYFDKVTNENGQQIFEYYAWRRWGYRAADLIELLHEAGLQLTAVPQIEDKEKVD